MPAATPTGCLGSRDGALVFDGPPAALTDAALFDLFGDVVPDDGAGPIAAGTDVGRRS